MLASRSIILRNLFRQVKTIPKTPATFQVRHSGHSFAYRTLLPPPSKKSLLAAELISGFMIWWILWHVWHESEILTGEWPIVEPSSWTDEELGIPPDSEGPAKRIEK